VTKYLLIDEDDNHAGCLASRLSRPETRIERVVSANEAMTRLRGAAGGYDLVIVNVSGNYEPWVPILRKLLEASRQPALGTMPAFLCVSTARRSPEFELQLERMGLRYVFER